MTKGRRTRMKMNLLRRLLAPEYLVKQEHRQGDLPDGKTAYGDVMRIALPSIIEMVLMSLIGTVDTIMVGNELGAEGLSSVGLPTQPRMVLLCLFFALNAETKGDSRVDKGMIILFHLDGFNTPEILDTMIPRYQEMGYKLVTVSELCEAGGRALPALPEWALGNDNVE